MIIKYLLNLKYNKTYKGFYTEAAVHDSKAMSLIPRNSIGSVDR